MDYTIAQWELWATRKTNGTFVQVNKPTVIDVFIGTADEVELVVRSLREQGDSTVYAELLI